MKDIYLKPGTYIPKSTTTGSEIAGLSLENFVVSVINNPTCCPKISGGGSGFLKLAGDVNMTSTLTTVVDPSNNPSILQLSSNETRSLGLLSIKTDVPTYFNIKDDSGDDRFSIRRLTTDEQVNLDFDSNPTDITTLVGGIRTTRNGLTLSHAMSFTGHGNVGLGIDYPETLFHIKSPTADTVVTIDKLLANKSTLSLRSNNRPRFELNIQNAEGAWGSNQGSDLLLNYCDDPGYVIGPVVLITRSTGMFNVKTTLGVNVSTGAVHSSAVMEVQSTDKGLLLPRMTTSQKNAISSPAAGLLIFDTTLDKLCIRTSTGWQTITSTP
jgi:hypothetical protein